jgi:hypothetical protein
MSELPSKATQAVNFVTAHARWVAAGEPTRSADEISSLFSICEDCPAKQFLRVSKDLGRCKECGCWLKRQGTFFNKLSMATESCPLGYF